MIDSDMDGAPKNSRPRAAWMVTFTDLVSLMLTFFVLLFSMSSVKMDEWDAMIDTLTQTLNPGKITTVAAATAKFNIGTIFRRQATNLDYLSGVLEAGVANDPMLSSSRIMLLDDRLVIAMPGDLLFPAGQAVMPDVGNQIGVNGHTDPVPPSPDKGFQSNWELSLARSSAVANALRRSGYTDDIIAYGYADSRFSQLPSLSPAERTKLARRVDIVIFATVGGE